jgi:hypothetical protein
MHLKRNAKNAIRAKMASGAGTVNRLSIEGDFLKKPQNLVL